MTRNLFLVEGTFRAEKRPPSFGRPLPVAARSAAGRLALRILEAIYEEIEGGWSDHLLAVARAVCFESGARHDPRQLLRELQRSGYLELTPAYGGALTGKGMRLLELRYPAGRKDL
jgi:hypothetical protein